MQIYYFLTFFLLAKLFELKYGELSPADVRFKRVDFCAFFFLLSLFTSNSYFTESFNFTSKTSASKSIYIFVLFLVNVYQNKFLKVAADLKFPAFFIPAVLLIEANPVFIFIWLPYCFFQKFTVENGLLTPSAKINRPQ